MAAGIKQSGDTCQFMRLGGAAPGSHTPKVWYRSLDSEPLGLSAWWDFNLSQGQDTSRFP